MESVGTKVLRRAGPCWTGATMVWHSWAKKVRLGSRTVPRSCHSASPRIQGSPKICLEQMWPNSTSSRIPVEISTPNLGMSSACHQRNELLDVIYPSSSSHDTEYTGVSIPCITCPVQGCPVGSFVPWLRKLEELGITWNLFLETRAEASISFYLHLCLNHYQSIAQLKVSSFTVQCQSLHVGWAGWRTIAFMSMIP